MSDVMLCGVLRMPPELWKDDPLQFMQVRDRMLEAADELEKRDSEIDRLRADKAELLAALYMACKIVREANDETSRACIADRIDSLVRAAITKAEK